MAWPRSHRWSAEVSGLLFTNFSSKLYCIYEFLLLLFTCLFSSVQSHFLFVRVIRTIEELVISSASCVVENS